MSRVLPHSIEAEENLLSCCFIDGADVVSRCLEARINPESFYDSKHGIIFGCLAGLYNLKTPIDISIVAEELKTSRQLDQIGGYAFLVQVSSRIPTTAQASYFIEKVREQALRRKIIRSATAAAEGCYSLTVGVDEFAAEIHAKFGILIGQAGSSRTQKLRARLLERRFDVSAPPPEPTPRFLINGKAVCTPGNLTNLIAQAKAGKSAFTGVMLAAAICAEFGVEDRDTLGVRATAPGRKRLLHLDTEQSPFDHDAHIRRALRRAGVSTPPEWLASFGLAGFSADELRESLRLGWSDAQAAGGVFAVIIDGTADLVNDVNDPKECNAFVAELHDLAIRHDCPIVNVVHENPGQDGGKMRGHLGSQLERKAESNLRLRKAH